LAERNRRFDRWISVAVAVLASSAAISLFSPWPMAGKILAVAAALAGACLAGFRHGDSVAPAAAVARQWTEIEADYDQLWLELSSLDDAKALERSQELQTRVAKLDESAVAGLPAIQHLMEKAQAATLRGRQLEAAV